MYLSKNSARDFYGPKKIIIKRHSSLVSPIHKNDYSVDTISVDSYDRAPSPQQNSNASSKTKVIETNNVGPKQSLSTAKVIKSVPWYKSAKGLLIATGILAGVCAIIVLPTVLAVVLTRNPSVTHSSTTPTVVRTATWNFDSNVNDLNGTYNGSLSTGAAYSSVTYFGYGSSLMLNSSSNGYVSIVSPFYNLSYTSFTVEAWINLFSTTGDNVVFSQCECGGCPNRCLSLVIRGGKLYMGFSLNVLIGTTAMIAGTWYHIAYVYDYSTRTQLVYIQGILDGTKTSSDPYQGQSGSIIIGMSNITSTSYSGLIDDLKVTTMAKSAADILNDATLVAYFSFDSSTLIDDTGPNKISGSVANAGAVTGKVGQGLSLSGTSSFFQAYAFYQLSLANRDFSFALWINPTATNGTLLQRTKSQLSTVSPCSVFMAFSTLGQIVFAIPTGPSAISQIIGPPVTINQWTHLGYTYSQTNGIIMYVNGVRQGSTGNVSYATWTGAVGNYDWLSIGQYFTVACTNLLLVYNGYYQGAVDEFYVYRRELTASAIAALANY